MLYWEMRHSLLAYLYYSTFRLHLIKKIPKNNYLNLAYYSNCITKTISDSNLNHVTSYHGALVAQTIVIMRVAGTNPYSAIVFGSLEISADNRRRR